MKIGIYGGSFNPIHKGHIKIARLVIDKLSLDKVIFVPAYKSPFKKGRDYEKAEHRVNMIKMSLEDKMAISLFEINRKGTSYTIETIKYFKNKYPDDELFLIIGTDHLYKLHKGRDIDKIVSQAKIVAIKRNDNFQKINLKKYNALLIDEKVFPYASGNFRNGDFSQITKKVNAYIGQNHLYVIDLLQNVLDAKKYPTRYKHCIETGKAAAKYAKQVNINPLEAWLAGTFHDITKKWSIEKHREFITRFNMDEKKYKDYQLHSLTASLGLEKLYLINNDKIVKAVRNHTSLSMNPSLLDKVVYVADKLAHGRKGNGIQGLRNLVQKDFEEGFKKVVSDAYHSIIDVGKTIEKKQEEVYKHLSGKE